MEKTRHIIAMAETTRIGGPELPPTLSDSSVRLSDVGVVNGFDIDCTSTFVMLAGYVLIAAMIGISSCLWLHTVILDELLAG